jgi:hypothetical protein
MIAPTIHLNGTGADRLLDATTAAMAAVDAAESAVHETQPNGRDYYPQGDGVYLAAIDEHRARMRALRKVRDELGALAENIADQRDAIAKARGSR